MYEEKFIISDKAKKSVFTILGIGLVLFIIGVVGLANHWFEEKDAHHASNNSVELLAENGESGHGEGHGVQHTEDLNHGEGHGSEHGHGGISWVTRIKADFWLNNIYFTGIAIVGVFFCAIQYITWAGWSASIVRVMQAFGYWLPVSFVLMLVVFIWANHDIFHWTHSYLYDKSSPDYDPIIAGKSDYLNMPFYIGRMIAYFALWIGFFFLIRKHSVAEDVDGGDFNHHKLIYISAAFVVVFGVTSSTSAWDWVMSIDTHWFSTMFGWYVFASWFVTGLSAITLVVILLKQSGYLKIVNANHLHDMGKFVFAFSIFWTYIWFSQFILYWYSNIPEETVYFIERFFNNMGKYAPIVILNLVINFLFPFLWFMTRDAKRQMTMLKVGVIGIMIGHWFDFYLMIMPGVLKEQGGLDLGTLFVELGLTLLYLGGFSFVVMWGLSKANLVAKNHPMLEESIHHHI